MSNFKPIQPSMLILFKKSLFGVTVLVADIVPHLVSELHEARRTENSLAVMLRKLFLPLHSCSPISNRQDTHKEGPMVLKTWSRASFLYESSFF